MNGINVYRETQVTTQSPGRLIVMLYEGAIRFLKQAVVDLENKDYAAKGKNIGKAQDIISELNIVLNMDAGEVSDNLRALYNFMDRHLSQANIKKDPEMIREVISLLEELNQSWKVIAS